MEGYFLLLFTSAYNFQDVYLDFEGKTQLCWDLGNWSFKRKGNVMVCGLAHEVDQDNLLHICNYTSSFIIFLKERINTERAECLISFLLQILEKNSRIYFFFLINTCKKKKKNWKARVIFDGESSKGHRDSPLQHNRQLRSSLPLRLTEFCNAVSQCHFLPPHF